MAEENIEQDAPSKINSVTIEQMMEENLTLTKEVHEMMRQTKRYMAVRAIMGIVYLILILAPIIFAFLYLPPLIKPVVEQYQSLINVRGGFDPSEFLQLYQGE